MGAGRTCQQRDPLCSSGQEVLPRGNDAETVPEPNGGWILDRERIWRTLKELEGA